MSHRVYFLERKWFYGGCRNFTDYHGVDRPSLLTCGICPHRYILNMTISDQTGKAWVTAFNDIALSLLNNRSADELNEVKDNDVSAL